MQVINTQPSIPPFQSPVDMQLAAKIYSKHSPVSLNTSAAGFFAGADIDIVNDLKKALMNAIDSGNFEKAIHILKCLKELGSIT